VNLCLLVLKSEMPEPAVPSAGARCAGCDAEGWRATSQASMLLRGGAADVCTGCARIFSNVLRAYHKSRGNVVGEVGGLPR